MSDNAVFRPGLAGLSSPTPDSTIFLVLPVRRAGFRFFQGSLLLSCGGGDALPFGCWNGDADSLGIDAIFRDVSIRLGRRGDASGVPLSGFIFLDAIV